MRALQTHVTVFTEAKNRPWNGSLSPSAFLSIRFELLEQFFFRPPDGLVHIFECGFANGLNCMPIMIILVGTAKFLP